MPIDRKTLRELANRLKMTSDSVDRTSNRLAAIGSTQNPPTDPAWAGAIESMKSINNDIAVMQRIVNVLWRSSLARPPRAR